MLVNKNRKEVTMFDDLTQEEKMVLELYIKSEFDNDFFEIDFKNKISEIDKDNKFLKNLISKGYINAQITIGKMGAEQIIFARNKLTQKTLSKIK